jgi:hypothetical protein
VEVAAHGVVDKSFFLFHQVVTLSLVSEHCFLSPLALEGVLVAVHSTAEFLVEQGISSQNLLLLSLFDFFHFV